VSDTASADLSPLVSRNSGRDAFRLALRLFVGRGRRYSVKQVANGAGIKDRVIECAMEHPDSPEYREPHLEAMLSLSAFLGPEFTCEWLHLAHQGAFWLPEGGILPPGEIAVDNADDNAVVTRAALNGQFDRDEAPELRVVGARMMARGAHLHAIGSKAA
jgi:hypothetical protein